MPNYKEMSLDEMEKVIKEISVEGKSFEESSVSYDPELKTQFDILKKEIENAPEGADVWFPSDWP